MSITDLFPTSSRLSRFALASALLGGATAALAQTAPTDPAFNTLPKPASGGNGDWTGSLGVGLTLSRGNSNSSQFSLAAEASRTSAEDRILFRGIGVRNQTEETRTADNSQASARYERTLSPQIFGFTEAGFERDTLRDIDLRQTYSVGLGHRLYQTDTIQLNLYGGVAYTILNHVVAPDADGPEPLVGNDFSYKLSESSTFTQRLVVYPHTVDTGGSRYVFEATVNTRIVGAIGLQVSFLQKFQSDVIAPTKKTDSILFTGLTAKF